MIRLVELEELLRSMFSPDELRDWILRLPDGGVIVQALPGTDASLERIVSEAVGALWRHRFIDRSLFDALVRERPRCEVDIMNCWMAIAELDEAAGDYGAAGERLAVLAQGGDVAAALQAVADFEHVLRTGDALRVARAALQGGSLSPPQTNELTATVRRLAVVEDRITRVEQRFDGPMDPRWHIVEPLALRADLVRGTLLVEAGADMGVLAELPIELTGEPLTFEFDLDVERSDWGTWLSLAVVAADGDEILAEVGISAGGGGGYLRRNEVFGPFGSVGDIRGRELTGPGEPSRHRLRATMLPGWGRTEAIHVRGAPDEVRLATDHPLRRGPHHLVLRSIGLPGFESQTLRARILRVALLGARVAAASPRQSRRPR